MESETTKTIIETIGNGIEYINQIRCVGLGIILTSLSGMVLVSRAVKTHIVEASSYYQWYKKK